MPLLVRKSRNANTNADVSKYGLRDMVFCVFAAFNLKNIPFSWNLRFFWALGSGILLHRKIRTHLRPSQIFLPAVLTTWSPLMELDFNLHKSNSTYFTDLDVCRAYLSGILFGPLFLSGIDGQRCNLIVGAVSCSFRQEIKPYESYETWTRVASWDEKWIYMVTHFVSRRSSQRSRSALQPGSSTGQNGRKEDLGTTKGGSQVLALAITQFVCKRGRMTIPPARALVECGLLEGLSSSENAQESPDRAKVSGLTASPSLLNNAADRRKGNPSKSWETLPQDIEDVRRANLPLVQLVEGWNPVYNMFDEKQPVLGKHDGTSWSLK